MQHAFSIHHFDIDHHDRWVARVATALAVTGGIFSIGVLITLFVAIM